MTPLLHYCQHKPIVLFLGLQLSELGQLQKQHTDAWMALWHRGVIEVDGNIQLARTLSASQYYIFSSVPDTDDIQWPFIGLSPSGLAWGDDQVTILPVSSQLQLHV